VRRTLLALLAGAVGLAAAPAFAQNGSITLRDRLVVVSSASSASLTQAIIGAFVERYEGVPAPHLGTGSTHALEMFCSGVGPQTPDIAVVTRRMPRAIQETCAANGVRDIIELQVGLGAVVLVARRGEAIQGLTSRHVWEALAAERRGMRSSCRTMRACGPISRRACRAARSA
jgi:phosphate transport system substrate-binding protein